MTEEFAWPIGMKSISATLPSAVSNTVSSTIVSSR